MNKLKRDIVLALCLVLAMCTMTACGGGGSAEGADSDYPSKTITLVIPYGAGGESDALARPIAQYMADSGFTVVVQNIEGAGGNTGVMEAYHANADGYTFMLHMPESMMCYAESGDLPAGPSEMMDMLCNIVYDVGVISVAVDSPFETLEDLIEYGKAHPGELRCASTATMGNNQFSYQMFCDAAGIEATYVPYENAAKCKAAVMGGHVDAIFTGMTTGAAAAKQGETRPLAVGATERSEFLPEVPTVMELGYDVSWGLHRTFMCPSGTPQEVREKLTEAIKTAFETDEVQEVYRNMGSPIEWMTGEEVEAFITEREPVYTEIYNRLTGK